jgi:hypothetical protein
MKGTQTRGKYVPAQSTDFIFTSLGEAFGFMGCFVFLSIYLFLLFRIVKIAERQRSTFSRVYAYSVASIIFFHIAVNVSMTIGLFPIVGHPAATDQLRRIIAPDIYNTDLYFVAIGCGQADGVEVKSKKWEFENGEFEFENGGSFKLSHLQIINFTHLQIFKSHIFKFTQINLTHENPPAFRRRIHHR